MTVVTPDYVRLTPDRQSTRGSIWNRVVSARVECPQVQLGGLHRLHVT